MTVISGNIRNVKKAVQKHERQAYWAYINGIIEAEDPEVDGPPKQKRFWNYIKSLCKDSTGVSPLKDKAVCSTPKKIRQTFLTDSINPSLPMRTLTSQFQTQMVTLTRTWNTSR